MDIEVLKLVIDKVRVTRALSKEERSPIVESLEKFLEQSRIS